MNREDAEAKKAEVFIRGDGWVFSADGMERLKKGGYKGHDLFMKSMESQLGKWHRVLKPLDAEAAAVVKSVKGLVARGQFVSSAIVKEAERSCRKGYAPMAGETSAKPAEFMRLTLTEDANAAVSGMGNAEFRRFVSSALLRVANKRR